LFFNILAATKVADYLFGHVEAAFSQEKAAFY
jgi:hypothetical protein